MSTKRIAGVAAAVIIAGVAAYAVSPYFTESTINEQLPDNIVKPGTVSGDERQGIKTDEMLVRYSGTFVGVNDGIHNAEGKTSIFSLDDGSRILWLEDFRSTNGPDLYVYLATDKSADDFVSLGRLKANQGNQTYVVPQSTDLEKYNNVLIWCRPFGVLFGSSEIMRE